ncbi:MAG: DCC1-like thiol-disulfide oxidoreductase family protein [Polyangiaceae bacterium]
MNLKSLLRHYARIDARSLGLFRIAMAITLLVDLRARMRDRFAFYSNEGVLPNHNHLFNLKGTGRFAWSALHAFSTPTEAYVGLLLIGVFYVFFLVGFKTRVFHALSLLSLVSLVARNLLTEGPGDSFALTLLLVTLFLPLGSTFSVDAFLGRTRDARETKPKHLRDDANLPTEEDIQAAHRPGFSPLSIAAFTALAVPAAMLLYLATHQTGAWRDGRAFTNVAHHYLYSSRWAGAHKDSGLLPSLTRFVYYAQYAIPALLVVPVLRGPTRAGAAILLALYGFTYASLTCHTLFGLSFAASALLVLANDSWERWADRHDPSRVRVVIFDVDCGICFWLSKMCRRLDTRRHLTFVGNDVAASESDEHAKLPIRTGSGGALKEIDLPKKVTPSLVEQTVIVVRADGTFATRADAVSEVLCALPGFSLAGRVIALPGVKNLMTTVYDAVAARRTRISVAFGLAACGVAVASREAPIKVPVSPARRFVFRVSAIAREVGAVIVALAIALQAQRANAKGALDADAIPNDKLEAKGTPRPPLPTGVLGKLEALTWWTRTRQRWNVFVPEPPTTNEGMVIDTVAKEGRKLDSVTNRTPPELAIDQPPGLGSQWANYLMHIQSDDYSDYIAAFKTYVTRRGPRWNPDDDTQVHALGADVYWLSQPIPLPPGTPPRVRRVHRYARGGEALASKAIELAGAAPAPAPGPRGDPPEMPQRPIRLPLLNPESPPEDQP